MTETAHTPHGRQRMKALEQANAVRLARAELKRRVAEGEVTAAQVILECPEVATRWTVAELLVAQRRWGSTRSRKFLQRLAISEIKLIGDLTPRQRGLLADDLAKVPPARREATSGDRSAALRGPAVLRAEVALEAPAEFEEPAELEETVELRRASARGRELAYA